MSISSIIDQICKLYCRKLNYLLIIIYFFFLLSSYSLTFHYQISKVNYNHHNRHIFPRSSTNKMYSKYMAHCTKKMMNTKYIKGYIHTYSTIFSRSINDKNCYNCYQYANKKVYIHPSQSKSRLSMKIDDTLLTTTIHVDNKVKVVKSIRSSSTSGSSSSSSSSSIGNSSTMTKNNIRKEWKKMLIHLHNDNSYGIITDKPKGGWYTIDRVVMDLDDKVLNRNDDDDKVLNRNDDDDDKVLNRNDDDDDKVLNRNDDDDDKVLNRNDDDEVSMDDDSRGISSLTSIQHVMFF